MNPRANDIIDALRARAAGRPIWIWGAGNQGRGICRVLQRHNVLLAGFLDRAADKLPETVMGLQVYPPDRILAHDFASAGFVVIASYFFEADIARELGTAGMTDGQDFVSYSWLKPNDYSVDISGTCNLKCISCPRAARSPDERKLGFMPMETYRKVLDKILDESPFVGNLQLYQWGEPTLHPQLPEIIEYSRTRGVHCAISSNLNARVDYARILAARPEWLRISTSGWGDDYEVTHTKGRWPVFLANLREVARLRREHHPEMKVEVYYHLYKHSVGDGHTRFQALCDELGLELHPVHAYLISLDDVLRYCEGTPLPAHAQQASELLLLDLDRGIDIARRYSHLPCDALRGININWDGSVSNCMMYYYPEANVVAPDYLEIPLAELQRRRYASDLCSRCMKHGIHQYCSSYARLETAGALPAPVTPS